ncbi:MAG: orotidine-5'-phosphate decarboxylase [Pseudomonadales bacterium]|jgi:orotidine-5'-phosphate decarboxylase|nr:orotidine-5'-phosphate decarboxylase [Pseudomonadales bacterium]
MPTSTMTPGSRIIVPLDFSTLDELDRTMETIYEFVEIVKIGNEVMCALGAPQVMKHLLEKWPRANVFFDGKFKDITNTVAQTTKAAMQSTNVSMINAYCDGSIKDLSAFVENAPGIITLGVTLLTHISKEEAMQIYNRPYEEVIPLLAGRAVSAGCRGIVCSAADIALLSDEYQRRLVKVTPAIRPKWSAANEQKRIVTPADAIKAGADYLVIGRPITRPPDKVGTPAKAFELIVEEIAEALAA